MARLKARFVAVKASIPDIVEEIRYATDDNFVGERIHGYEAPAVLLTREAAGALAAAKDARKDGLAIKIYDAYRPQAAVDHFVAYSKTGDKRMKRHFYPGIPKDRIFARGFVATRSGHSRGSTVAPRWCTSRTGRSSTWEAPSTSSARSPMIKATAHSRSGNWPRGSTCWRS